MKTAQQWFEETLPKNVAEMAVKNIDKGKESIEYPDFCKALISSFVWRESPQGFS